MHNGGMRIAVACALLVGCSFEHGILPGTNGGDGGTTGDGKSTDGKPIDAPCMTYSSLFDTCAYPMGSTLTLTPGQWYYDTDNHRLSLNSQSFAVTTRVVPASAGELDVIFVAGLDVQAGATLRPFNPLFTPVRGLAIVATGPITINGTIDLGSGGAGARSDLQCGPQFGRSGQGNNGGGGGGGGGAFQGAGGSGSNGNLDGTQASGGGIASAIGTRPLSPIGGCDGGRGGGTNQSLGGDGGDGGGALYLASAMSITIGGTGILDAVGQGGYAGGNNGDGGGGGGSGGMILLESKMLGVTGTVVANGGGGGEGNTNGNPGQRGQRSTSRANGGQDGDANGGDGGGGGAGTNLDGESTDDVQNGGGGGGGGGVGYIAIACPNPTLDGVISPVAGTWP